MPSSGTLRRVARSVLRLLVTANVVPSSPILVTLMMEAIRSSETSALTRATRRHIPKDGILQHQHLTWTFPSKLTLCLVSPQNAEYVLQDYTALHPGRLYLHRHRRENLTFRTGYSA
jgi:hypothetical protein